MEKQRSFIEHSCCFVTLSKAKGVKIRHERFLQKPGQGAFMGGRDFAKDTELFYSGLIFHGEYNEVAMELAWKVASSISLPEDWRGKIFKVEKQKLYIIEHPHAWTSSLNYPGHNSSYHASILGNQAIIRFDHAAFCFEEIFVDYGDNLTLTNHSPPIGKRNTEKNWPWHQEEKSKFEESSRKRKKTIKTSSSLPSTAPSGSDAPSMDTPSLPSTAPISSGSNAPAKDSLSLPSTAPTTSKSTVTFPSKRGPPLIDGNISPSKKQTVVDLTTLTEEQIDIIAEKYGLVKRTEPTQNIPPLFDLLTPTGSRGPNDPEIFKKDFHELGVGHLQKNHSCRDELERLRDTFYNFSPFDIHNKNSSKSSTS